MEKDQFQRAADISTELAVLWYPYIIDAMNNFGIVTPAARAMFIAQIGHESGGFKRLNESFNYSISALNLMFSKYISAEKAAILGRAPHQQAQQQAIANLIYANRGGNKEPGDGWKYRGRGLIQISMRNNYIACGKALDLDLVTNPDLLLEFDNAAYSAAWFWQANGCSEVADDLKCVTRKINGGYNGLDDRQQRYDKARAAMA